MTQHTDWRQHRQASGDAMGSQGESGEARTGQALGVVVGLDSFIDIGVRTRPAKAEAPVADGDVSGQVASVTSA